LFCFVLFIYFGKKDFKGFVFRLAAIKVRKFQETKYQRKKLSTKLVPGGKMKDKTKEI